jgi:hypothetical protein
VFATHSPRHRQNSPKRCQGNTARLLLGLVALAVLVGIASPAQAGTTHQGRVNRAAYSANVGEQWGTFADAQITRALANDPGANRPYADVSLAYAISKRAALGWDDPAARHYLNAALSQPTPYGVGYSWDAFGDHTMNPANTTYSVTLVQVGEVVLDAYQHGAAAYTDVTDIERLIVSQPRITSKTPGGLMIAYSNSPNDVKPGYGVHNVNQAVGLFLREVQQAGILWSDAQVKSWIAKIYVTERAAYQPKVLGWAYRDGGSQALQDAGHNGVGAIYGMTFNPSSIGLPMIEHAMTTDYGYAQGGALHATLAAWDCSASRRWFPEWGQVVSSLAPVISVFDDSGRFARPLAYSGQECAGSSKAAAPKVTRFKVLPVRPSLRSTIKHVAPDAPL